MIEIIMVCVLILAAIEVHKFTIAHINAYRMQKYMREQMMFDETEQDDDEF